MRIYQATRTGAGARRFLLTLLALLLLASCQASPSAPTEQRPAAAQAASTARRTAAATAQSPSRTPSPTAQPTATETARPSATQTTRPTRTGTPTLEAGMIAVSPGRVSVPILLYHHVSDRQTSRYTISVASFRAQMKYLHEQGYQTVHVSRLAELIREGGTLPEKAVVITFDDGYLDTYTNAFPILQEYGFTATAYIITSTLDEGKGYGYMQEKELSVLLDAGWEIGSHSVTHTDLNKSQLGIGNEMKQSRERLETLLGTEVRSFSYPFGIANAWIRERAEAYGYESAVGLDIVMTQTTRRLYYLSRREVTRSVTLNGFADLLLPLEDEIAANPPLTETPSAP